MSASIDLVALTLLPPWRWRTIAERLRAGETPGALLDWQVESSAGTRAEGPLEPVDRLRARAHTALERAARHRISAVDWNDPAYPPLLKAVIDPPLVLWLRGPLPAFDHPAVAIVGSRNASSYALQVSTALASDLAARGIAIVSGLARGVDSAAHRGALSVGGITLAVMGCGVDRVYPREHADLAAQIGEHGALISELVPSTPPLPHFFPMRNRIISGLSRAVIVVEAGEKSGSLITARYALEQGRDVLAVPGNVLSGRNRGGHALLKDGAAIVESVDDVLAELGFEPSRGASTSNPAGGSGGSAPLDPILARLAPGEPTDLDAIAATSGLAPAELLTRLLELELQGFVRRVGGGRFVRLDRSC